MEFFRHFSNGIRSIRASDTKKWRVCSGEIWRFGRLSSWHSRPPASVRCAPQHSSQQMSLENNCDSVHFQSKYSINLEKYEVLPGFDRDVMDPGTIRVAQKERNVFVINGKFSVNQNIGPNTKVSIERVPLNASPD